MNLKKIVFICLILMILSVTAVSAADSDNINATDSIEPAQTVEHDTNLQPISEKKTVDISNIKATSTSPGTFDDLQVEINNAEDGSVLVLTRDYTGHYGSRIHLDKDITIDGQGHTLDCLGEGGCSAFYSTTGNIVLKNIRIINGHNDYNDKGGAIHIEGSAKYTLENCIFENNWAKDYGGAIYNNGLALTIKNCTFTNNKADESGGAIFSQNYEFYLKGCIFKSNNADRFGGAIYHSNEIKISNCTFENNHAEYQGGCIRCGSIYINTDQSENESLNTYFIGNTVSNSLWETNGGGAIFAFYGGKIVNAYFKDNQALIDGGAIYSGDVYINHCLFESNTANGPSVARCYGGAIYSRDVYIHNSTFKDNSAYDYGGAIYANNIRINHDREMETADTFFIDNKAKDNDGGAIYAKDDVFARNVAFINNVAWVDGGAICAKNNVEVRCCIFESNQATGAPSARCYGGAIRAEENARINDCTFKNNHAYNRGGAVHASTVTLEGGPSRFEGNSANDYGGAIYTETFTDPVSHATFINNIANAGDGGAVYINSENNVIFTDCAFIGNIAISKGGAIFMDSKYSHINIVNSVFINNSAGEGQSVYTRGYYDTVSANYWSTIPSVNNDQLVEWKAWPNDNIHHTDSNPVVSPIETPTFPGTFDDLQIEINNAEDGSVLLLTRDYTGHYGSRIHLNKDITIDGQGHTLDCLGKGGCSAFFSTTGNIVLKNIRIINGHNNYNNQGGALHIEGSAQYTLENCIFENNWAEDYGGAIYNDGETITIKNCTFNGNTADDKSGGAIYSTKDIIIEGSTFTNNCAYTYGGAIGCAGTLSVNANQGTGPYTSFFNNNKVKYYNGGAIEAETVNIKNAEFKKNNANIAEEQ